MLTAANRTQFTQSLLLFVCVYVPGLIVTFVLTQEAA